MTAPRITTWQQPDDLWAFRLEEPCGTCDGDGIDGSHAAALYYAEFGREFGCDACNGTGTFVYSQHGFRTRELALVRARQVALERTREPRRYEETIEVEAL